MSRMLARAAIARRAASVVVLALVVSCGGGGTGVGSTGDASSEPPPSWVGAVPAAGATGVPVGTSVDFTYSQALTEAPQIVLLGPNGKVVAGLTRVDGATASFTPYLPLTHYTDYSARAWGGAGIGGAVVEVAAPAAQTAFRTAASLVEPAIEWADGAGLVFHARQGGTPPPAQFAVVLNAGGGVLGGLHVAPIVYGKGAHGWVRSARLDTLVAPASLRVEVDIAGLAPGEYLASILVAAPTATNLARDLAVRLRVD